MTDKVQKIREEVERLKGWNNNVRNSTRHMTLQEEDFNRGKHSSYLEILNFIDSLQEEPVSEELEEAVNAYIGYAPEIDESSSTYGKRQAFKTGAQWQKEQFEKNRLKHCNSITNEQAELERGFIDQHLDKYNCIPSYLDAIEYGMNLQKEQIMKDAVICAVEPRYNKEIGRYLSLDIVMNEQYYKVGDRVKMIIVKE